MNRPVLVIGYGNELRGDDGAGPFVARAIAARELPHVRAIAVHQLVPELSDILGTAELAILVDAGFNTGDTVRVCRLEMTADLPPLGHASNPQELLALAQALQGRRPEVWLVTVPVVSLDFAEGLSPLTHSAAAGAVCDIARLIADRLDP